MKATKQNKVVSATPTSTVEYKPSPQRVEFELLLTKLAEEANGVPYTDELKPLFQWACDKAVKQQQIYTTPYGHKGFSWGTREGRYSITRNAGTNYIYVRFKSWAQLKEQKEVQQTFQLEFS